jgi:hypothetical protein
VEIQTHLLLGIEGYHTQHWSEDLLLHAPRCVSDIGNDGGSHVVSLMMMMMVMITANNIRREEPSDRSINKNVNIKSQKRKAGKRKKHTFLYFSGTAGGSSPPVTMVAPSAMASEM